MDKNISILHLSSGRVTYNFHSSCKHTHLSFKSIWNKEHKGVIWLPWAILPKALILQDECFGKNYSSFLVFTCNHERTSGIFVPCHHAESKCIDSHKYKLSKFLSEACYTNVNKAHPDQMPHYAASDLDLHCCIYTHQQWEQDNTSVAEFTQQSPNNALKSVDSICIIDIIKWY